MPNKMSELQFLTAKELSLATAGGYNYIRTLKNDVRGLALRKDLNPKAPEIIPFGTGKYIQKRAELFLNSKKAVPTYVKRKANVWEYIGVYRAITIKRDDESIKEFGSCRKAGSVAGILFLELVSSTE